MENAVLSPSIISTPDTSEPTYASLLGAELVERFSATREEVGDDVAWLSLDDPEPLLE